MAFTSSAVRKGSDRINSSTVCGTDRSMKACLLHSHCRGDKCNCRCENIENGKQKPSFQMGQRQRCVIEKGSGLEAPEGGQDETSGRFSHHRSPGTSEAKLCLTLAATCTRIPEPRQFQASRVRDNVASQGLANLQAPYLSLPLPPWHCQAPQGVPGRAGQPPPLAQASLFKETEG